MSTDAVGGCVTAALWLSVGSYFLTMSRFPVFYCAMPDIGAGIHPVDATDAFEAEQLVQQRYPGAITASLSPSITDQDETGGCSWIGWRRSEWAQLRLHD